MGDSTSARAGTNWAQGSGSGEMGAESLAWGSHPIPHAVSWAEDSGPVEMSRTHFLPSREIDKKPVTRPSALERQWSTVAAPDGCLTWAGIGKLSRVLMDPVGTPEP